MKRGIRLVLVLVFVVAAAGIGWWAGSQTKSQAQLAAEAEPPEPSLITVPVELKVITNDVVTRGTVRFESPVPVSAQSVVLPDTDSVITMMPEVGATFDEGDAIYKLAGRPTFVILGDVPLFRANTVRGDKGEDIAQFQEALIRLGFLEGEADGTYGRSTEKALVAFYESRGYEAYRPKGESRYSLFSSEFVFFESLPVRVASTSAARGDVAAGEIMKVSGSGLTIESSLDVEEANLVSVGAAVVIDHELFGIETTGVVTFKADAPGTNELAADKVYVEITPDEILEELDGANVRITIPVSARSTEAAVLAVPAAALSATGSGETIVTVVEDDGMTRTVIVTPGLATPGGLVQVTAENDDLSESDWVVVGFERGDQ